MFFIIERSIQSVELLKGLYIFPPLTYVIIRQRLGFSCEHSSHAAITREECSLTFPQLSTARHSFIQLSEQGRHGENELP